MRASNWPALRWSPRVSSWRATALVELLRAFWLVSCRSRHGSQRRSVHGLQVRAFEPAGNVALGAVLGTRPAFSPQHLAAGTPPIALWSTSTPDQRRVERVLYRASGTMSRVVANEAISCASSCCSGVLDGDHVLLPHLSSWDLGALLRGSPAN